MEKQNEDQTGRETKESSKDFLVIFSDNPINVTIKDEKVIQSH